MASQWWAQQHRLISNRKIWHPQIQIWFLPKTWPRNTAFLLLFRMCVLGSNSDLNWGWTQTRFSPQFVSLHSLMFKRSAPLPWAQQQPKMEKKLLGISVCCFSSRRIQQVVLLAIYLLHPAHCQIKYFCLLALTLRGETTQWYVLRFVLWLDHKPITSIPLNNSNFWLHPLSIKCCNKKGRLGISEP